MSNSESRVCKHHGYTIFSKRTDGKFRCRKCSTDAVSRRRKLLKQKAVDYMGGACTKCGYKNSLAALEFHHKDPKEKDFGIGNGDTRAWAEIQEELDKCILVCSNCHREIHENAQC